MTVKLKCRDCIYYATQEPVEGMYVCHRDPQAQSVAPGYWCRHHALTLGRLEGEERPPIHWTGPETEPTTYGMKGQHEDWVENTPDEHELLGQIREAWLKYLVLCRDWKLMKGEKDEDTSVS